MFTGFFIQSCTHIAHPSRFEAEHHLSTTHVRRNSHSIYVLFRISFIILITVVQKRRRHQLPTMNVLLTTHGYTRERKIPPRETWYMCEHIGLERRSYLLYQIAQGGQGFPTSRPHSQLGAMPLPVGSTLGLYIFLSCSSSAMLFSVEVVLCFSSSSPRGP